MALLALLAACVSDAPAYFGGDYNIAVTARENGCGFSGWTSGATATNIQLQLLQNAGSSDVTGTIQGGTGFVVQLLLGTNMLAGRVSGRTLEALLTGVKTLTQGTCQYNILVDVNGELSGDVITGTIDYTTRTNHAADCGAIEGCHSFEDFNGTRPPSH